MNKTININLAGIIFHVDEEAYRILTDYLAQLKAQFASIEGGDEIMMDIEARMAELFSAKLGDSRQVVGMVDVQEVIEIMGQPEDYADSDDATSEETTSQKREDREYKGPKRLYRDPDDNILGGVCSGLAAYFSIDPIWIRLAFVALVVGAGTGFWLYIVLWIVIPEAKTTAQKLQMRGEKINISNIERAVRDEMKSVSKTLNNLGKDDRIKRSGNKIAQGIEDVFTAIVSILGALFKFVFKTIGIVFLAAAVLVIVVLFSAGIGHGIDINGANIGLTELYAYLPAILPSGYDETYVWTAFVLLLVGPVIGLIMASAKILFNYRLHNKAISSLAGLLSFSGFVMLAILGFSVAREFKGRESESTTFAITNATVDKPIILKLSDKTYDIPFDSFWHIEDDILVIDNVSIDVRRTREESPYIEVIRESHGRSRRRASDMASNIQFEVVQEENTLYVDEYLSVPVQDAFRDQEVDVVLYLPEGYSVFLDNSVKDVIYDVDNVTDMYDRYMVDHVWMMTSRGLACADCDDQSSRSYDDIKEHDEWERAWIEEAEQMERELENAPSAPPVENMETRQELPQREASVNTVSLSINTSSFHLI